MLKRRTALGPNAFVFGSPAGEFLSSFKTAWESLLLVANGHATKRVKPGAPVDRAKLRPIDLHWHDLRHEGACRLLRDGVDIRNIQLMLGHADIKQTQRYLNITDEELRKAMTGVWERRRQLRKIMGQEPVSEHEALPIVRHLSVEGSKTGAPGRIRTCGLWLRRPTLYPAELRAHLNVGADQSRWNMSSRATFRSFV